MAQDIIGDIHGHADRLEALLAALGYRQTRGAWRHHSRTAVFVGDFIDRGPAQLRTLRLVRDMIDGGAARAVMGNHELNAIGWATADPATPGDYLRPRRGETGRKNLAQHRAFLDEVGMDSPLHAEWIDWFLTLPLWIETPSCRVVHACWDEASAATLRRALPDMRLTRPAVEMAYRKGDPLHEAIDIALKGPEARLPPGVTFTDKDGHVRDAIRTRWWDPERTSYRDAYIGPDQADLPATSLPEAALRPLPDRPVFIGHYWLDAETGIAPLSPTVCCLDYSVARGGPLVAYRFDDEPVLSASRFVSV